GVWGKPVRFASGNPPRGITLNSRANGPGTFVTSPPAGPVLPAGNGRVLSVTFTPNDPVTYTTVTKTVLINVVSTSGRFAGRVTNAVTGSPIAAATVTAHDLSGNTVASMTSDAAGDYLTPP